MPGGAFTSGKYPQYQGAGVIEDAHDIAGSATLTGGAGGAWLNPLGADLIIVDAFLEVTVAAATPANTMNIGIANNPTTSDNTLFTALTAGAGIRDARKAADAGASGAVPRRLGAGQYITITPVASTAGLVGTLHIVAVRA